MFRRRGGATAAAAGAPITAADRHYDDEHIPAALSPAELRAGLDSLGIPLSDADLGTLVAKTDPDRRGEVSYADFCDTLKLHYISDDEQQRPTTSHQRNCSADAAALLTSYDIGKGTTMSPRNDGGGGLGSARRRAMALTPRDDANLDGGLFHRNPATEGCANPNFTTSMIPPAWNRGRHYGRGRERSRSMSDIGGYRPGRRQSPAPAPGLRYTGGLPSSQGQSVLLSDNHSRLWSSTGEEAEISFRHVLGIKSR